MSHRVAARSFAQRLLVVALISTLASPVGAVPATAAPVTAPPDAYESPARDDTPSAARDVTDVFVDAYYASGAHSQPRTFDFVDDATHSADEDWIKFTVTANEYHFGHSYLLEAVASFSHVDPVIEVYGPYAVGSTTQPSPTPLALLGADPARPEVTRTDPLAIAASWRTPWSAGTDASVSLLPPAAGVYYVRVRPYYQHAGGPEPGFRAGAGTYALRMKVGQMTRVAGADRVLTAVAISRERFRASAPASDAVVLASGWAFPDALAGSTLAGALECPMLLTSPTRLSTAAAAEIVRLGVGTVYVLGGPAAVSEAVTDELAALGLTVRRVAGDQRTATALAVARMAAEETSTSPLAFVASAHSFADALAASPMAAHNAAPVLLTATSQLSADVREALADPALAITDVVIVGGTAVVSRAVEDELIAMLGRSRVRRIAGASRYETARHFAVWATDAPLHRVAVGTSGNPGALATLDFSRIGIASGQDFPDALAGGVSCGLAGSPILLTRGSRLAGWVFADWDTSDTIVPGMDYYGASDRPLLRSYLFGGSVVLDRWGVYLLADLITGPGIY